MTHEQTALLKKARDSLRGQNSWQEMDSMTLRRHAYTTPCFTLPRRYCLEKGFRFRSTQL
jgi:hypothetical protein